MVAERRQENFDSRAPHVRRLSMPSIHGVRETTTKWKWVNYPQILIPAYSAGRTAIAEWPNSGAVSIRGYIGCLALDRFSIFCRFPRAHSVGMPGRLLRYPVHPTTSLNGRAYAALWVSGSSRLIEHVRTSLGIIIVALLRDQEIARFSKFQAVLGSTAPHTGKAMRQYLFPN